MRRLSTDIGLDATSRASCELVLHRLGNEVMPLLRRSKNFLRRRSHCEIQDAISLIQRGAGGSCEISMSELEFGAVVGEGASGIVFKASWRGKPCAAKMLKHGIKHDSSEYRDLITELSMLTRIGPHRNLISFYGAIIDNLHAPVIVEEFMDGTDLETFLNSKHVGFDIGQKTAYRWSADILSALNHLHDRDPIIMHRDLKPSNILLSRDRKVLKLADFGLAKEVSKEDRAKTAHASNTGTLRYMAPEVAVQLGGEEEIEGSSGETAVYTEKADIYSAALIIWYILTGMRPYIDIRVAPLDRPNVELSRRRWLDLSVLVERMWHQHPERRPSARGCLDYLEDLPSVLGRGCFCALR